MSNSNRGNNFSYIGKFLFENPANNTKYESLEYYIQDFATPSRTLNGVELKRNGKSVEMPGDTITEDKNVTMQFIIDEELKVLLSLRAIQDLNVKGKTELFNLQILDNKSKPIANAKFTKMFIKTISEIRYSFKDDETTMYLDVTVGYLDFDIESV